MQCHAVPCAQRPQKKNSVTRFLFPFTLRHYMIDSQANERMVRVINFRSPHSWLGLRFETESVGLHVRKIIIDFQGLCVDRI